MPTSTAIAAIIMVLASVVVGVRATRTPTHARTPQVIAAVVLLAVGLLLGASWFGIV